MTLAGREDKLSSLAGWAQFGQRNIEEERTTVSFTQISAQDLLQHRQANPSLLLIDVRTPTEFRSLRIEFAENVPLDRLDPQVLLTQRTGRADEPLYVVCLSGGRSKKACEKLVSAGFRNVINVVGGTQACAEAGLPVIRSGHHWSLERQTRIVIGSLVVLGAVLGYAVHPGFYGLSAFMGLGMIFAGLTDSCAMGMVIARMPWNRGTASTSTCQV